MAWSMEGTYYENCSCDAICPCTWSNMARRATRDDCRVALLFEVERGTVEGVDVAGTAVVVVMQTPANMSQGNFKAGVIVGSDASDAQTDKLAQVFSGALGGPIAGLASFISEFLGVERLPIRVDHDAGKHHIVVGDALDVKLTMERTPEGAPVQLTNIVVHPAGPTLDVAVADGVRSSVFGIDWSGDGLSGFSNPFAWAA